MVSASTSSSLSLGPSGSSSIEVARTRPPPQPGADVEQLRPGERDHEQRRLAHPRHQVLDQLEQRLLGPVDVLEDEHERLLQREPLRPFAPGPRDLLLTPLGLHRLQHAGGEAQQVGDRLVLAEFAQLLDRDVERVVVDDPGCALHHLGQRPVGDALAVRQAAAGENGGALERLAELVREPALPHAGLAVDREQVRAAVAQRPVVGVLQQLELGVAADQRRLQGLAGARTRRLVPRTLHVHSWSPRPFRSTGPMSSASTRPSVSRWAAGPISSWPGSADCCEPRGDGHRLAGREGRVGVVGDDLAGLDADARLELELAHFVRGSRGPRESPARRRPRAPAGCRTRPSRRRRRTSRRSRRARSRTARPARSSSGHGGARPPDPRPSRAPVESTRSTNRTVASLRSMPQV